MQINGLGQISATAVKAKRSRASSGGSFVDVLEEDGEAEARAAVSTTVPLNAASTLLALQELPDAAEGRSRGLRRGQDMLEGLEDLRCEILAGVISGPRLRALSAMTRQKREVIDDPRLLGVLDDIELRVEVELAKLETGRG